MHLMSLIWGGGGELPNFSTVSASFYVAARNRGFQFLHSLTDAC